MPCMCAFCCASGRPGAAGSLLFRTRKLDMFLRSERYRLRLYLPGNCRIMTVLTEVLLLQCPLPCREGK